MGVHALIKKILSEVGINPDRYNLQWASAAEAPRFVKLITDFTARVKELGPLGADEGISEEEARARIDKAIELVSGRKLRVGFGNLTKNLRKELAENGLDNDKVEAAVEEKLSKTIATALEA